MSGSCGICQRCCVCVHIQSCDDYIFLLWILFKIIDLRFQFVNSCVFSLTTAMSLHMHRSVDAFCCFISSNDSNKNVRDFLISIMDSVSVTWCDVYQDALSIAEHNVTSTTHLMLCKFYTVLCLSHNIVLSRLTSPSTVTHSDPYLTHLLFPHLPRASPSSYTW